MQTTTHTFDAEVRQLLDLVIHSLYSDREVFLRELVSNASDALDRARVAGLSNPDLTPALGEPGIDIRIDPVESTITVSDNGIGLTADQAREHLGTIAHSGTKAFAKALEKSTEHNLIGQFGVGFYAALMVSDHVTVHSLSGEPDAEAVTWSCDGSTEYTLAEGARESRGTDIVLKLREDSFDFLDKDKLTEIIRRYSEFVSYPIRIAEEQVNEPVALWTKRPQEVDEAEVQAFYKQTCGDWADPATHIHVHADAPVQFKALLFVPAMVPQDLNYTDGRRPLKLYAKRVLILEEARELLPEWLRFVRGVVDSEDIKLNVSREMVQQNRQVRELKEQLVNRVLRHFKKLAKNDEEEWTAIWSDFGSVMKEGFTPRPGDTTDPKDKLTELARFRTTAGEGWRSLAAYVEDMPEDQDTIWFLTAPDAATAARSPHLEAFKKKGIEVVLLTDPVDEWLVGALTSYKDIELKAVSRGELDLEDDEPAETVGEDLVGWLKTTLATQVKDVRVSNRLTDSPSVLVDDEHGMSANMQRMLSSMQPGMGVGKRVLEINPGHPLVRAIEALHGSSRTQQAAPLAHLLVDQAKLTEGHIDDPASLVDRLQTLSTLLADGLGVGAPPADHPVPDEPSEDSVELESPEILDSAGDVVPPPAD
ncbi:MAG: molecular chaperone HtpG [Proteobacteria bacterium]|nr:molecular chaperone HtpG [Pseudomonadota bacterium]MCP4916846.1 molecular chaperone HtpG [Pseudomonadota bacterium]